jgi:hypothetical protein
MLAGWLKGYGRARLVRRRAGDRRARAESERGAAARRSREPGPELQSQKLVRTIIRSWSCAAMLRRRSSAPRIDPPAWAVEGRARCEVEALLMQP